MIVLIRKNGFPVRRLERYEQESRFFVKTYGYMSHETGLVIGYLHRIVVTDYGNCIIYDDFLHLLRSIR